MLTDMISGIYGFLSKSKVEVHKLLNRGVFKGRKESRDRPAYKKKKKGQRREESVHAILEGLELSGRMFGRETRVGRDVGQDCRLKNTFCIHSTVGNKSKQSIFTDYAPKVFGHLRRIEGVDMDAILASVEEQKLKEEVVQKHKYQTDRILFRHSNFNWQLIEMPKKKFDVILSQLPNYFLRAQEKRSHLIKILGMHSLTFQKKLSNNLYFISKQQLARNPGSVLEAYTLDLQSNTENKIQVHPLIYDEMMKQINLDLQYLADSRCLGYKLSIAEENLNKAELSSQLNSQLQGRFEERTLKDFYVSLGVVFDSKCQKVYHIKIFDLFGNKPNGAKKCFCFKSSRRKLAQEYAKEFRMKIIEQVFVPGEEGEATMHSMLELNKYVSDHLN